MTAHISPVLHPLYEQQIALEEEMIGNGKKRFFAAVAKAKQQTNEAGTGYGTVLMKRLIDPITAGIMAFTAEAESGRAGPKHRALAYIQLMEPEVVSYLTLKSLLDTISRRSTIQRAALRIANALQDEVLMSRYKQADKREHGRTMEHLKESTSTRHKRTVARLMAKTKAGVTVEWGDTDIRHTFKSKEAADVWFASAKLAIASGKPVPRPELSTSGNPEADSGAPAKGARFAAFASRTHTMYWKGKPSDGKNMLIIEELKRFFVEDITLDRIDAEMLDRLVESFILRGNSNSTINKKLAVVSRIVRFAHSRGHLNRLPTIERKKAMVGRFRFFTEVEEKTVLAHLKQLGKDDHHEAVECLIDTGMRTGELWSVPAKDYDLKARSITIWANKTNLPRTIYMTDRVHAIVKRRKTGVTSENESLFPYDNTWMRGPWDRVRNLMQLAHDPNFVPYVCRHTCASRMVQRGVPIPVIKEWLGHKTITMTMRYAVLAPTNLMAAVSALEPEKVKAEAEKELEAA